MCVCIKGDCNYCHREYSLVMLACNEISYNELLCEYQSTTSSEHQPLHPFAVQSIQCTGESRLSHNRRWLIYYIYSVWCSINRLHSGYQKYLCHIECRVWLQSHSHLCNLCVLPAGSCAVVADILFCVGTQSRMHGSAAIA